MLKMTTETDSLRLKLYKAIYTHKTNPTIDLDCTADEILMNFPGAMWLTKFYPYYDSNDRKWKDGSIGNHERSELTNRF